MLKVWGGRRSDDETLSQILRLADQARDARRCAEAADRYGSALALAPHRTDIRIQRANMLKDSHRFAEAEATYLEALSETPLDADIHLQLGHLRKLTGRRDLAVGDYRKALALNPRLSAAHRELAASGAAPEQMEAYQHMRNEGGLEALLAIRNRLDDLSEQVAHLRRMLPDALASVAFPVEAYDELRRLYDVPPPSAPSLGPSKTPDEISIGIVLHTKAAGDLGGFHRQLSSVRDQTHSTWKVHVVGSDPDIKAAVDRASVVDPRISWVESGQALVGTEERAAARTTGTDWVLLLGAGACLHPRALSWISAIGARTGCDAIIFDEEVGGGAELSASLKPILRQTFDRDTLLEANVYGDTVAVSSRALKELEDAPHLKSLSAARSALLLALSEKHRVAHAPLPLIRRAASNVLSPEAIALEHAEAVRAHLGTVAPASGIEPRSEAPATLATIPPPAHPTTPIAVIIPTRDNLLDLKSLVKTLVDLASSPKALAILVLNNGGSAFRTQLDAAVGRLPAVKIVDVDEPFNWSRFNNLGVTMTSAPYLVFANDDMRMLSPGWDNVIRSLLERTDVGAVGARLLYPNDTIQHAGILFGWRGGVIHDGLYEAKDTAGPALRWQVTRSTSAVTGAFLATRRADFEAVGGFDAAGLAVSYSDVDYGLRLRSRGLRILWTPSLSLYHYESKSRGLDHLSPAKAARYEEEQRVIRGRWPRTLDFEPSVNPMWHPATLPHRLLSFPSREQLWAYIEASAARNPWLSAPPKDETGNK